MKTIGEIEAGVTNGMVCFLQEYMGRAPSSGHTHLIGDLVVVRLREVLTVAEQRLVKNIQSQQKAHELVKAVRLQLLESGRPLLVAMVEEVTGVKVLSMQHDISMVTGEEFVLFTMAESPAFRATKGNADSGQCHGCKAPVRKRQMVAL